VTNKTFSTVTLGLTKMFTKWFDAQGGTLNQACSVSLRKNSNAGWLNATSNPEGPGQL
jgi:hypothetical protein